MKYSIFILFILSLHFSYSQGNNVTLLSQWSDSSLPPVYDGESVYNEVWGITKDGIEYAIIGSRMGTHIFRVNASNQLVEIDFVMGKHTGSDAIHRDYHDYQ
ncbi:MAG: hypothetical protein VX462_05310, partial [Bacteroidota bacterium]|nr:hypothetical protein [Bacteroidota bacterium]